MIVTNVSNKPKQHLVLFDIDGTLIVGDAHLYENHKILSKIHRLQQSGVCVGISTNRSAEMAQSIYDYMRLNGPFLVEQGANLTFEHYKTTKKNIARIRITIIKYIIRLFSCITNIDIKISNRRHHTVSIFVSNISNIKKMSLIVSATLKLFPVLTSVTLIDNQRIYIRDNNITKHSSVNILIPDYQNIYVIGDDEHDKVSSNIHYLGVYCSQSSYNNICEYSTKKPGADGIVDLLEYIHTCIKES